MCKKTLNECRTHEDFVSYGKHRGGRVVNGGRHTLVYGPTGGMAPIPNHKGDLAKGTRYSIVKMFIAIGLACMVIVAIAV